MAFLKDLFGKIGGSKAADLKVPDSDGGSHPDFAWAPPSNPTGEAQASEPNDMANQPHVDEGNKLFVRGLSSDSPAPETDDRFDGKYYVQGAVHNAPPPSQGGFGHELAHTSQGSPGHEPSPANPEYHKVWEDGQTSGHVSKVEGFSIKQKVVEESTGSERPGEKGEDMSFFKNIFRGKQDLGDVAGAGAPAAPGETEGFIIEGGTPPPPGEEEGIIIQLTPQDDAATPGETEGIVVIGGAPATPGEAEGFIIDGGAPATPGEEEGIIIINSTPPAPGEEEGIIIINSTPAGPGEAEGIIIEGGTPHPGEDAGIILQRPGEDAGIILQKPGEAEGIVVVGGMPHEAADEDGPSVLFDQRASDTGHLDALHTPDLDAPELDHDAHSLHDAGHLDHTDHLHDIDTPDL